MGFLLKVFNETSCLVKTTVMCIESEANMVEKLLTAFFGAFIALVLREFIERRKSTNRRKNLAALCATHLKQIRHDLESHVEVEGGAAKFHDTNYRELVVGDFLYDLFTTNIELFPNAEDIQKTTTFFHHYKINMSTVKSRLEAAQGGFASLTELTYNNLKDYLNQSIDELEKISST
jgi:hypothetical protein